MRQEAELRVGGEDLLVAGRHRHDDQPGKGGQRDPGVTPAPHLDQDCGRNAERYSCEQLVGDAEQRPQRVDAAERIDHALIEEVAPPRAHEPARHRHTR